MKDERLLKTALQWHYGQAYYTVNPFYKKVSRVTWYGNDDDHSRHALGLVFETEQHAKLKMAHLELLALISQEQYRRNSEDFYQGTMDGYFISYDTLFDHWKVSTNPGPCSIGIFEYHADANEVSRMITDIQKDSCLFFWGFIELISSRYEIAPA